MVEMKSTVLRERSPHPYTHHDLHDKEMLDVSRPSSGSSLGICTPKTPDNCSGNVTDNDDEQPRFLKALPPSHQNSHKGLMHADGNVSPLYDHTQLDLEERLVSKLSKVSNEQSLGPEKDKRIESQKHQVATKIQSERNRRISETILVGVIGFICLCGVRIWELSWPWYLVMIMSQFASIVGLIALYPISMVSIEHSEHHLHIWSRFYIPPSFDPANVLYPIFLPWMITVILLRDQPELFLSNLVLGLASLPERLFPDWSHMSEINNIHWSITVIPIIANRAFEWIARRGLGHSLSRRSYAALTGEEMVNVEMQLFFFPLHQALVITINYLTTSSLLPAEKKLLASVLINLLFFSTSPQTVVLKTALWIGGLGFLITCKPVLTWAVDLARASTWRPKEQKDNTTTNITGKDEKVKDGYFFRFTYFVLGHLNIHDDPYSTIGPSGSDSDSSVNSHKSDWVLRLTAYQVQKRKILYTLYVFIALGLIAFGPVLYIVTFQALQGQNPIVWGFYYALPLDRFSSMYPLELFSPFTLRQVMPWNWSILSIPTLRNLVSPQIFRLLIAIYSTVILFLGLALVMLLTPKIETDTRRKIFHAIMVLILIPTLYIDPCFLSLLLSAMLSLFLVLEVLRASQIYPFAKFIGLFLAPYVDGRDLKGPMVISHVFLLVGCAIPFWLSLSSFTRDASGWELMDWKRETAMLAGVVCVGMGDAAASLIGRRYGRRKWGWIGGKSLEGSAAFAIAVVVGLTIGKVYLRKGGWEDVNALQNTHITIEAFLFIIKATVAGCAASFMEAVLTGANDNVVVPIALWLLCKGMKI